MSVPFRWFLPLFQVTMDAILVAVLIFKNQSMPSQKGCGG